MERLILSGLFVGLIGVINTPAVRADITAVNQNVSRNNIMEVQPFNLVYLGYQGYFQNQGIPSNGAFIAAVQAGRVNEVELVKSAIDSGRLSPQTLNDQSYLRAVKAELRDFDTD
ncbi:MAG: hypothetical protein AB4426_18810 [Xenococcaceae cyanobacterium]